MEEPARRGPRPPDDSSPGQESNRVALPLLQAPGSHQCHRVSNFCIDNILRPDFGRRTKGRTLPAEGESPGGTTGAEAPGTGGQRPGEAGSREHRAASADPPPKLRRPEPVTGSRGADVAPAARPMLWPAWVYCTRYSDRPSSGPRTRRPKKEPSPGDEDKRPRTAFTAEQLLRLRTEFQASRYLTEQRRRGLARDLGLSESQVKIWFQNRRAKVKKSAGDRDPLAQQLMAQGLYDHSTAKDARSDSDESHGCDGAGSAPAHSHKLYRNI